MGLFGSISKALFGKKKPQTSESGNLNNDYVKSTFGPMAAYGSQGMGALASLLGLGGSDAQSDAVGNWWDSSGGDFLMNQGMDQILGNRAAGGLLRSGGTSKAIEDYRSGLASTKLGEYAGLLGGLNQQALGAGGLISSTGQYSKGTGANTEGGGLGKAIGLALSIFSDRRLKTDIHEIAREPDGLGVYRYRYLWDDRERVGVMADEVADLRPWALGPEIQGYRTVNYHLLEAA